MWILIWEKIYISLLYGNRLSLRHIGFETLWACLTTASVVVASELAHPRRWTKRDEQRHDADNEITSRHRLRSATSDPDTYRCHERSRCVGRIRLGRWWKIEVVSICLQSIARSCNCVKKVRNTFLLRKISCVALRYGMLENAHYWILRFCQHAVCCLLRNDVVNFRSLLDATAAVNNLS